MFHTHTVKFHPLLLWLAVLAAVSFWSGRAAAESQPAEKTAKPDKALFDSLLEINRAQEPELKPDDVRGAFKTLVSKAQAALANAHTPREKIAALNEVLLAGREVKLIAGDYGVEAVLSAALLKGKGNCLSVSVLYVLLGEELGLPIRLVAVPSHFFARWDDGTTRINIETTSKGAEYADEIYLYQQGQLLPEDIQTLGWGRSLDKNGLLAECLEAAAFHRATENHLDGTLPLMNEVEKLVPARVDLHLQHLLMKANTLGKRIDARKEVSTLLDSQKLPPSVFANAVLWLASEAESDHNFELQRRMLLSAFPMVPKSYEFRVLQTLAFCQRNQKDLHGAARYMELAASVIPSSSPECANAIFNLAIFQKNDGRPAEALESIRTAPKTGPGAWNLQLLEAGLLVATGDREGGLKLFEKIERPATGAEAYEVMAAWFYAVSKQRDKFYPQLDRALAAARTPFTLASLEDEPDLAAYRNEPEFKALFEKYRQRLAK